MPPPPEPCCAEAAWIFACWMAQLADADKASVIKAARAKQPAPLIFVSAPRGSARPDNIDGALPIPVNADDARKLVEICIRAKMPTRVLIVDDSDTMRSIVRKILAASRFALDIHEAEDGSAALDQLRNGNFGMVFLDYNMPGLNGADILLGIKRESPNVAIVMMTSALDNGTSGRAAFVGRARRSSRSRFIRPTSTPCSSAISACTRRADASRCFEKEVRRRPALLPVLIEREFAVADARAEPFGESGGGFLAIGGDEFGEGGEQAGLRQAIAVDAVEARFGPRFVKIAQRHAFLFVVRHRLARVSGSLRCRHFDLRPRASESDTSPKSRDGR